MKTNYKIEKSFICKTCQTTIHKNCLGLRLSKIRDINTVTANYEYSLSNKENLVLNSERRAYLNA